MKTTKKTKNELTKQRQELRHLLEKKAASYECLTPLSLERNIGNQSWRTRLINTLLTWASDSSSIELVYFFRDYNISRDTFYHWTTQYDDVKEAFKIAKVYIAANRRSGAIQRKFDSTSAYRGLYRFDPEEEEIDNYIAKLKKSSGENGITGIICIDTSKPQVQTLEELIAEKNQKISEYNTEVVNDTIS